MTLELILYQLGDDTYIATIVGLAKLGFICSANLDVHACSSNNCRLYKACMKGATAIHLQSVEAPTMPSKTLELDGLTLEEAWLRALEWANG